MVEMTRLKLEGLTIDPAEVGAGNQVCITLTWKGQSAARNPTEVLMPFFRGVLDAATGLGRLAVEMHFEELDYLNSVTVAALIRVIEEARRRLVPLVFVYDHRRKWQELNFRPVQVLVNGDGLFQMRSI